MSSRARRRPAGPPARSRCSPHLSPPGSDVILGAIDPVCGRAALASCRRAIAAALSGEVDAVVAAPHNQTAIAAAGIAFDGYPGFLARETGMREDDVFLMLCFSGRRIVHCTLHVSVRDALALLTQERVGGAIRATDAALRQLEIARPKILVGGLNPHAGEGGLFGREEIEIIAPAIAAMRQTVDVDGPFGCDTMLNRRGAHAYIADAYISCCTIRATSPPSSRARRARRWRSARRSCFHRWRTAPRWISPGRASPTRRRSLLRSESDRSSDLTVTRDPSRGDLLEAHAGLLRDPAARLGFDPSLRFLLRNEAGDVVALAVSPGHAHVPSRCGFESAHFEGRIGIAFVHSRFP